MTTNVTNPPHEDEELLPESKTHIGRQIRAIRDLLGSVQKELSYQGLADVIGLRTGVEISGPALRTYELGQREPSLSVVEALSKIDPRGYTPAQIAGWDELPAPSVEPVQRADTDPPLRGSTHTKPAPTTEGQRNKRGA